MFAYFRSLLIVSLIFKRMFLLYTVVYFMRRTLVISQYFTKKEILIWGQGISFSACRLQVVCTGYVIKYTSFYFHLRNRDLYLFKVASPTIFLILC